MSDSKVVLVAGAGGGMGGATVARLAKDGFRVAGVDINLEALATAMDGLGDAHSSHVLDVTDQTAVQQCVTKVIDEMGSIDVLVNLVGWAAPHGGFVTESSDYWGKVIAINYESLIYLTHAVLPHMIERGSGKLVAVASDAGRVGQSREAVYAGCKGAVIAFMKSLARELARHGITANCTSPGPTDTPLERAEDPDLVARIIRQIPMRRWAQPDEQAAVISFLCSADSDYMTGQTISVSGGLTML